MEEEKQLVLQNPCPRPERQLSERVELALVRAWGSMIRLMKHGADSQVLTIPKEIVTDKRYPFKLGDRVMVKIDSNGIRVERANGDE